MWENTVIDLGDVSPNSTHEVEFKYNGDKSIDTARAGCGCTIPLITETGLTVKYSTGAIPKYLVKTTTLQKKSDITVTFKDNSVNILTIKCNLK